MFLRVVRANVSKGVKREYVRVVEAYRDHDGKTRHRTVINLGRRDLLATHLDLNKLDRLLHGDVADDGRGARDDVGSAGGPETEIVRRTAWRPVLTMPDDGAGSCDHLCAALAGHLHRRRCAPAHRRDRPGSSLWSFAVLTGDTRIASSHQSGRLPFLFVNRIIRQAAQAGRTYCRPGGADAVRFRATNRA
jgi:hypothetical protein